MWLALVAQWMGELCSPLTLASAVVASLVKGDAANMMQEEICHRPAQLGSLCRTSVPLVKEHVPDSPLIRAG